MGQILSAKRNKACPREKSRQNRVHKDVRKVNDKVKNNKH